MIGPGFQTTNRLQMDREANLILSNIYHVRIQLFRVILFLIDFQLNISQPLIPLFLSFQNILNTTVS